MNETIIDVIGDQGVKKRSISSDLLNEIVLECSRDSSSRLLNYDDTKIDNFDLSSLCPENEGMFNNLSLNKLGFESSAGIEEVNSTENINIIPSNKQNKKKVTIGPQHFDLLKLIGEGAFGKVILVKNILNNEFYAMKVISKKLLKKKNNIQYMKSERDILTKLDHPFIVSLRFAFQSESKLFLVMDFLSGGELFFHLKRRGLLMENDARFYFSEMILAIEFLHNNGIIHRDLKPENVLLKGNGHVCLTDFGLAKEIGDSDKVRTLCGTSEYMAPEMIARNGYSKSVDWWSLGALFYEMLTSDPPFMAKSQKELDRKILSEKFTIPSYLTAGASSLLKGLLEKDSNKRLGSMKPTMFNIGGVAALKQHVFFESIDWIAIEYLEVEPPNILDIHVAEAIKNGESELGPTIHFHEGFTGQNISYSVVEETLSNVTSPNRSRAGSDEKYDGFDYAGESFECTEEEIEVMETHLKQKLAKVIKKKLLKQKKENERNEKLMLEEQIKRVQIELDEKLCAERLAAQAKEKLELEKKIAETEKMQKLQNERNYHLNLIDKFNNEINSIRKKVKSNKKKLRDIADLNAKIELLRNSGESLKLSCDQQEKLAKRELLEQEVKEFESQENNILLTDPGPLPQHLQDCADFTNIESIKNNELSVTSDEAKVREVNSATKVNDNCIHSDKSEESKNTIATDEIIKDNVDDEWQQVSTKSRKKR
jgi:p70 ribosomal S6 kinase